MPVGGFSLCLLAREFGFVSKCLPAGCFTEVWFERGKSTINPYQE
ncbi:MAG: hypothetical protein ACJAXA_003096, partial [Candidatus Aldehydirespiratoraceae bacterium]